MNSHEVRAGDCIVGHDGRTVRVERVAQRLETAFAVSNLSIGEFHNYAVGTASILVHNVPLCAKGVEFVSDLIRWKKLDLEKTVADLVKGGVDDRSIREVLDRVDSLGPWKFGPSTGITLEDGSWWDYLEKQLGGFPTRQQAPHLYEFVGGVWQRIKNLHAHHIAFKEGSSVTQRLHSIRARRVLEEYGLDWYLGPFNLVFAPNRGHTGENIKKLADRLEYLRITRAPKSQVIDEIKDAGEVFARTNRY